jgi:DNA-binding response OmpR family regulator
MSTTIKGPVLVVEDDANIASLVATYLRREGFEVLVASDGEEALHLARQVRLGFVILDLMLPSVDGWEVCRQIRRGSDVPILMLTARGDETDRVRGFSLEVDDYVVKPFSPRELLERVKAILRRTASEARKAGETLTWGSLVLDPEGHTVSLCGAPLSLTPSEYRLLHALLEAPGRVYSRDELLDRMHDRGEVVIDRVVDVHVGKLRQKIEPEPSRPRYLLTVRGAGYKLAPMGPE